MENYLVVVLLSVVVLLNALYVYNVEQRKVNAETKLRNEMEEFKDKFVFSEGKHRNEMEGMKEELKLKSKSIHEQTSATRKELEDIKLKLQEKNTVCMNEIDEMKHNMTVLLKETSTRYNKTLQDFKKGHAKTAFFVTMKDGTEDLTSNTILKFTGVKTNIGDGYHSGTGKFTAPVAGVYEFNASFITNGANWLELHLIKNGEFIVRGHAHMSHASTGTLNAILMLQKGDAVYLRHPRSFGSIHGTEYSMFSGHQL